MTSCSPSATIRLGIIGGGISGLAAAHTALRDLPNAQVTLLEATDRVGGVLGTGYRDGYLHEKSADNFLITSEMPWLGELADQVGYRDELVETNSEHRRALVYWNGQLHPIPEGFQLMATANPLPILSSSLLSWRGKARLACESFVRQRTDGIDESLAEFATRRVGREAYERLVQPLVAGIYTADPERLSVAAALPQFHAMEKKYGSLTKGLRQRSRKTGDDPSRVAGARYAMFYTPRQGMQHFVDHLANCLPAGLVHHASRVERISLDEQRLWHVTANNQPTPFTFDALILAVPAWQAAQLLRDANSELSAQLSEIHYANAAVVSLAVRREQLPATVDAFGIVVPAAAKRQLLAASFSSVKFPHRAPAGHVLIRAFVGGACQESLVDLDDDAMQRLVRDELHHIAQLQGEPEWWHIQRWYKATPQYEVGHLDRISCIERLLGTLPQLALAGNAYRGVGMPQCVRSGQLAVNRIRQHFASSEC